MDGRPRRGAALALLVAALLLGLVWYRRHAPPAPAAMPATASRLARHAERDLADRDAASRMPAATAVHVPGAASDAGALCAGQRRMQIRALRASMDPAESPETAIAHAMLLTLAIGTAVQTESRLREVVTARKRWPDDVDLTWLEARYCAKQNGCDERAARQRLQALEPENAAVWLEAMEHARTDDDNDAWEAALSMAAAADFYDPRLGLTFIHLRPALARLPLPPDCERVRAEMSRTLGRDLDPMDMVDMEAQAIEAATALPGLSALRRCRPQDPRWNPAFGTRCAGVLRKIGEGDTFVEQRVALALLIPLVGEPESTLLRERYRRLQWLMSSAAVADRIPGFIPRMWAEGEPAVLRDWLQRHGHWPPPADWLPDDPQARALIRGDGAIATGL